jgi:hypothetical protein
MIGLFWAITCILFIVPLRLPCFVQFIVICFVLLLLACCSVGLASTGLAAGWAIGWAIGWCL